MRPVGRPGREQVDRLAQARIARVAEGVSQDRHERPRLKVLAGRLLHGLHELGQGDLAARDRVLDALLDHLRPEDGAVGELVVGRRPPGRLLVVPRDQVVLVGHVRALVEADGAHRVLGGVEALPVVLPGPEDREVG